MTGGTRRQRPIATEIAGSGREARPARAAMVPAALGREFDLFHQLVVAERRRTSPMAGTMTGPRWRSAAWMVDRLRRAARVAVPAGQEMQHLAGNEADDQACGGGPLIQRRLLDETGMATSRGAAREGENPGGLSKMGQPVEDAGPLRVEHRVVKHVVGRAQRPSREGVGAGRRGGRTRPAQCVAICHDARAQADPRSARRPVLEAPATTNASAVSRSVAMCCTRPAHVFSQHTP